MFYMGSKLFPFWWLKYVRVHPLYVCWWNGCEDCGEWTIAAAHSCSVDTADKQEETGSIKLVNNAQASGDLYDILSFGAGGFCDNYHGFWIKYNLKEDAPDPYCLVAAGMFEGTDYFAIQSTYDPTNGARQRYIFKKGVDSTVGDWISFVQGTWYWMELRKSGTAPNFSYTWYRNGVLQAVEPSSSDLVPDAFRLKQNNAYYMGTVRLDYIRLADRYEYPPE